MNNNNNTYSVDILQKGFIDEEVPENINLVNEIYRLRNEKNAVILAHYYQEPEIQDIADYVGDSLALSQIAAKTDKDMIVFAGVHFMAETAKIINPSKRVLIPDMKAGCSLADSCPPDDFRKFCEKFPNHKVISYINTSAAVKTMSDVICTSSNAVEIVNSFPENQKLIFAPDRNLGNYVAGITGRKMVIWNGACHVHEEFSIERILELKKINKEAKILAHPECEKPVLIIADFIGSTSALLDFTKKDSAKEYIVATETGILHQMKKLNPEKIFIPAPPKDSTCGCSDCRFMKMITLKKLYLCLKEEKPEIFLEEETIRKASVPIIRMLELSKKLLR